MNKKGVSVWQFWLFIFITFAGGLLLAKIMVFNGFHDRASVESEVLIEHYAVANILSCFAYHDPLTGNVQSGIIDNRKVTQSILQSCFPTEKNNLQLQVTLEDKKIATVHFLREKSFKTHAVIVVDGDTRTTKQMRFAFDD